MILDWARSDGSLGCHIAVFDAETGEPVPQNRISWADDDSGVYRVYHTPFALDGGMPIHEEFRRPIRFGPRPGLPLKTRALVEDFLGWLRAGKLIRWGDWVAASDIRPIVEHEREHWFVEWLDEGVSLYAEIFPDEAAAVARVMSLGVRGRPEEAKATPSIP